MRYRSPALNILFIGMVLFISMNLGGCRSSEPLPFSYNGQVMEDARLTEHKGEFLFRLPQRIVIPANAMLLTLTTASLDFHPDPDLEDTANPLPCLMAGDLMLKPTGITLNEGVYDINYVLPQGEYRKLIISGIANSRILVASAIRRGENVTNQFRVMVTDDTSASSNQLRQVTFTWEQLQGGAVTINTDGNPVYTMAVEAGRQVLNLPRALEALTGRSVSLNLPDSQCFVALTATPISESTEPAVIEPILADPGMILCYEQTAWRSNDFELFRWEHARSVLIFDFRDYAVQKNFLGRLGFFSDVAGEQGTIKPFDYYADMHSYNAHDYRPDTLAAFFNYIGAHELELTQGESFVRDLCLAQGLLTEKEGRILPGTGALLSVAREIPSYLRARLLRHECAHGLFFTSAQFRQNVEDAWSSLSLREQTFWKIFLGNKGSLDYRPGYTGYEADDHYLLINEMQAHMLQLERSEITDYFLGYYSDRIIAAFPDQQELIETVRTEDRDGFLALRMKLEQGIEEACTIADGQILAFSEVQDAP